ncbi:hypothetical protein GEMRC1_004832 [Eukaryota sp. GEM-RC1]
MQSLQFCPQSLFISNQNMIEHVLPLSVVVTITKSFLTKFLLKYSFNRTKLNVFCASSVSSLVSYHLDQIVFTDSFDITLNIKKCFLLNCSLLFCRQQSISNDLIRLLLDPEGVTKQFLNVFSSRTSLGDGLNKKKNSSVLINFPFPAEVKRLPVWFNELLWLRLNILNHFSSEYAQVLSNVLNPIWEQFFSMFDFKKMSVPVSYDIDIPVNFSHCYYKLLFLNCIDPNSLASLICPFFADLFEISERNLNFHLFNLSNVCASYSLLLNFNSFGPFSSSAVGNSQSLVICTTDRPFLESTTDEIFKYLGHSLDASIIRLPCNELNFESVLNDQMGSKFVCVDNFTFEVCLSSITYLNSLENVNNLEFPYVFLTYPRSSSVNSSKPSDSPVPFFIQLFSVVLDTTSTICDPFSFIFELGIFLNAFKTIKLSHFLAFALAFYNLKSKSTLSLRQILCLFEAGLELNSNEDIATVLNNSKKFSDSEMELFNSVSVNVTNHLSSKLSNIEYFNSVPQVNYSFSDIANVLTKCFIVETNSSKSRENIKREKRQTES